MTLLSASDAAEHLGQSVPFVRSLCRQGLLDYRRVNGRYYIPRVALEAWVNGTQVATPPPNCAMPRKFGGRARRR